MEVLLRREAEPAGGISAQVERGGTDIARALEVAMAAFPPGGHKRVVLLSDGRENLGRAAAAAAVGKLPGGGGLHRAPGQGRRWTTRYISRASTRRTG